MRLQLKTAFQLSVFIRGAVYMIPVCRDRLEGGMILMYLK